MRDDCKRNPITKAPDGWSWLDLPYTNTNKQFRSLKDLNKSYSLSPILQDVSYLVERLHIITTYKTINLNNHCNVTHVRVYAIPSDIDGNRYIRERRESFKRGKTLRWHENRYKAIMKNLITVLDYSEEHWNIESSLEHGILLFSALKDFEWFKPDSLGASSYYNDRNFDYHLQRMIQNQPFNNSSKDMEDVSLEGRLTNVYNSVKFSIERENEILEEFHKIKGLKSSLYKYQMESASKMFINELRNHRKLLPNLFRITKYKKEFYFNSLQLDFLNFPEYYLTPRGGILAENMGLGKTFIVLALICFTKFEVSTTPAEFVVAEVKDHSVNSLRDHCVRLINRESISWKNHVDELPESCIKQLDENPGYFYFRKEDSINRRFLSRSRPIIQQEKILLTSATLIVCPDNLFTQWMNEVSKHVEDNFLSVFKVPQASSALPEARELIKHDIVIMSFSAYVHEDKESSELFKIYWKRFIIDEGHSLHQRSSRVVNLSAKIKVERRWAVTGTPTTGMTKLHMHENEKEDTVKRSYNPRDDLIRLGYLVNKFFQIEPWSTDDNLWRKTIVKPFVENHYGTSLALNIFLTDLIIRHSTDQIDNDVSLPPLYHKPIFLKPSYHNKISINLFTAVLAINAVSSEREDRDYMFHAASKADLRVLITNLQRSTFYWTGFSTDDLQSMVKFSIACTEKTRSDGSLYYSTEDIELLRKCIKVCNLALFDKSWRTASTIHEMMFFIQGLDKIYSKNFGIGKDDGDVSHIPIFGAPQLYELQRFYYRNRFSTADSISQKTETSADEFWENYWKEATRKNTERAKKNDGQAIQMSLVNDELDFQNRVSLKSSKSINFKDPNQIKSKITGRINDSNMNTPEPSEDNNSHTSRILGTASAKLSYMISKLLENYYRDLKSIVFFEFEESAYYLSEALDILGLPYLLYSTSVPKIQRPNKIEEFTNHVGGNTLIMDLKLASHGLTIIAATRVYFLNPVWRRSVEAQAIKRAHRIGQKEPVYVETLILEGTLEEEMFNKRSNAPKELMVPVSEDDEIRKFILQFRFLKNRYIDSHFSELRNGSNDPIRELNQKKVDDFELCEHSAFRINNELHWNVPLFNKDSQVKMSEQMITKMPLAKDIDKYDDNGLRVQPNISVENIEKQVVSSKRSFGLIEESELSSQKKVRFG
ncbi:hypothetical protein WICMUC_003974 [Wickerhamomyces mucosus]|uniref:Uncharacterized protein n=1 Tax=Wickerhamomyces mucosus TaxID=1378264 RepID=A0A9P8TBZ6_9ASCO|nr:hypothetical protein WICMUC_003974 [Wickerhamomyces mucosus]